MKATDLRIGNLVYISKTKQEAKVFTINKTLGIQVNDNLLANFTFEEIKPIKLTEKWLIDFGFEYEHFSHYFFIAVNQDTTLSCGVEDLHVDFDNFGVSFWIENELDVTTEFIISEIKYIHELQNLYYTLSGGKVLTLKNK